MASVSLATVLCLLLSTYTVIAHDEDAETTVCTTLSTIITNKNVCAKMEERILALEEQVRQLQHLSPSVNDTGNSYQLKRWMFRIWCRTDCEEIFESGVTTDGVHTISPDGRCPFHVYCDMTNGGWTLIQKRLDGTVSFYRDWNDYVAGFGDVRGEHWLGLDKIHRLTEKGSQIYFHMERYDQQYEHAHYTNFIVHDVATGYRMNVDPNGYEGTIPELLSYHDGMKFSTYDRDNDQRSSSCVTSLDGGGWWYNSCYRLGNVNGIFEKKANGGIGYVHSTEVFVHRVNVKVKRRRGMC